MIHIVPFFPPRLGGMEQRTQELAAAQAAQGHRVTVLTAALPGTPAVEDSPEGYRVERLRLLTPARTVPVLPTLIPRLGRTPPDSVWHVHVAFAFVVEQVLLAARAPRRPFVAQMHIDPQRTTRLGVFLAAYKRLSLGPALRGANAVVAPTAAYGARIAS